MSDIRIRHTGLAGRITLTRPGALNALTPEMLAAIDAALQGWAEDDAVALVILEAEGARAFCAGGDVALIYEAGQAGAPSRAQAFWQQEYRLNARIFRYRKPVVSFLHGITMGGGVGIGCHASYRIVCEGAKIAMPECGIGLVPDVGGSLILARAPGHLGEYLGMTAARMGPADAIHAGFADHYIPRDEWPALIAHLERTGDWARIERLAAEPPPGRLAEAAPELDAIFGKRDMKGILAALKRARSEIAREAREALETVSPLSANVALALIRAVRAADSIEAALEMEYRFTHRAIEQSDLMEGIRARITDKDRAPRWRHAGPGAVPRADVAALMAPLGPDTLDLGDVP